MKKYINTDEEKIIIAPGKTGKSWNKYPQRFRLNAYDNFIIAPLLRTEE